MNVSVFSVGVELLGLNFMRNCQAIFKVRSFCAHHEVSRGSNLPCPTHKHPPLPSREPDKRSYEPGEGAPVCTLLSEHSLLSLIHQTSCRRT